MPLAGRKRIKSRSYGQTGDPNGIRTRVTAVKGRCPRPLDDRVTKPANIPFVRGKANWPQSFVYRQIEDKLGRARGRPGVDRQNVAGVLHHLFAVLRIGQKIRHGPPQFGC